MSEKNVLRLLMIPITIIYLFFAVYLVNQYIRVLTLIGAVLIYLSPFILFAVYKAGCIIIHPGLANKSARKGISRLLVVCEAIIIFAIIYIYHDNLSGLLDKVPPGQAVANYDPEASTEHVIRIGTTVIVVLLLSPVAIRFVVKGFAPIPSEIVTKASRKRWKVCDNCGRIMDKLDRPQDFENKILCERCHKQLKAESDNSS